MDDFGTGLLIITFFLWITLVAFPLKNLIFNKKLKSLLVLVPITGLYVYYAYVILTGTRTPGCVTWHAVGTGEELVEDKNYYGGRWRNNEHWEHSIGYVPEYCECVTYHWPWGDENNFTTDSVIRGQFKGPSVKPNKLVKETTEDDFKEEFEEEFFQDGVYFKMKQEVYGE